jgi:hypothetical protein
LEIRRQKNGRKREEERRDDATMISFWEKVYFTPDGWNTSPPTYENGFFTP